MTFACKITVSRMVLIPVFAVLAIAYGQSTAEGEPIESLRWWALAVFVLAAVSDGVDGWVARRFNQTSRLGAMLDPIADKLLVATGVLILSLCDWGRDDWHLPLWFALVVVARDVVIVGGIGILWRRRREVKFVPHWTGKVTTVTQFLALGWVMLGWLNYPPEWTCSVAAFFTAWSTFTYLRQGVCILRGS